MIPKTFRCLVLDIDGVCTDGRLTYGSEGVATMTFNAQDGAGIKALLNLGYDVAIISGNRSPIITYRMQQLGVKHIYLGQEDKQPAFDALLHTLQIKCEDCIYIGDDLPDIPLIQQAGLGCSVANGQDVVKEAADYVTQTPGGHGAVREVINFVLAERGSSL